MRKLYPLVLTGCLVTSLSLTPAMAGHASALQTQNYLKTVSGETIHASPTTYIRNVEEASSNPLLNESSKIELTCKTFLTMARASVRNQSYHCTELISTEGASDSTIQYRLSEYELLHAIQQADGTEIYADDIKFSNFSAEIFENTATASVVEEYSYYVDEGFDDDFNYRMREYTFTLEKENDNWCIAQVVTNDPWETEDFDYAAFAALDVRETVQILQSQTDGSRSQILNEEEPESLADQPMKWIFYTYSPTKAVNYAKQWYSAKNAQTANPVFGYASNNCQNFASQCIWAGLNSENSLPTRATDWPAVPTSLVGKNAPNVWCRNQSTSYYQNWAWNWSWDNVGGFTKLIETSSRRRVGPVGTVRTGLSYAKVGDEIAYATSGTPSSSNLKHAMFVTSVTGTAGSRGVSNIKIAANNAPTNSAYQSLSSYSSLSASQYLTIAISGSARYVVDGSIS